MVSRGISGLQPCVLFSFIREINGGPLSDLERFFFVCLHYKKRFADCVFFFSVKWPIFTEKPGPDCAPHGCYSSCCFPLQKLTQPSGIISAENSTLFGRVGHWGVEPLAFSFTQLGVSWMSGCLFKYWPFCWKPDQWTDSADPLLSAPLLVVQAFFSSDLCVFSPFVLSCCHANPFILPLLLRFHVAGGAGEGRWLQTDVRRHAILPLLFSWATHDGPRRPLELEPSSDGAALAVLL